MVAVVVLGWGFKRGIVDPLLKFGVMPLVVATLGLAIALRNGVRAGYSAEAHPFPSLFADKLFNVAGVNVSLADIGTLVIALALIVVGRRPSCSETVTGRAMQAVAQNTDSATRARHRRAAHGASTPSLINAVLAVRRGAAGHADLPRQVRHGRVARHQGVLRRDHRRLQHRRAARCSAACSSACCENLAGAYISPAYKDGSRWCSSWS